MATLASADGVAAANIRGFGEISDDLSTPLNICVKPECATYNGVTISGSGQNVMSASYANTGHPANAAEFMSVRDYYTNKTTFLTASGSVAGTASWTIEDTADYCAYTITGTITVTTSGGHYFAIDSQNASELWINGSVAVGWYGGHGVCSCTTHSCAPVSFNTGDVISYTLHGFLNSGATLKIGLYYRGASTGDAWKKFDSTNIPTYSPNIYYYKYILIRP